MKNIVITGVSTGIGYSATKKLIENQYRVFGSVRKQEDANKLKEEFGKNFYPLMFDVKDEEAIKMAALKVKEVIGDDGIDCLINNSGIALGGPIHAWSNNCPDIHESQDDVFVLGLRFEIDY